MPCGRRHRRRLRGFGGFGLVLGKGPEAKFRAAIERLLAGSTRLHPNWGRSCDSALLAVRFGGEAVQHANALGDPRMVQLAASVFEDVMRNARRKCR